MTADASYTLSLWLLPLIPLTALIAAICAPRGRFWRAAVVPVFVFALHLLFAALGAGLSPVPAGEDVVFRMAFGIQWMLFMPVVVVALGIRAIVETMRGR